MKYLDSLNEPQQTAATHVDGPLLCLAGAGSGKTRMLIHRVAYLIDEKNVNPWNILAITFTNKAAGELRERVDKLVGFGADSVWVSTFHSLCVRILRRFADRLGYDNRFTIYDTDDQRAVMKDVVRRLELDPKRYKERAILSAVSSAKDELLSPDDYAKGCAGDFYGETCARAYRMYQEQLRKNDAMDFDDLIVNTVGLFREHTEILDNYQERFRYIMVDEYQDTNTAQFKLIELLAAKYRNLCVVGDDDQSIYRFRGANIRNILDFEKVYPEAKVVRLEQNYRSTQHILDAANAVIANNTGRKEKRLWTDKGDGAPVHFRQFDNAREEAEYVVDDIRRRVRSGKYAYRDCAALYRTNAQSRMLEEAFIMAGIPYEVVGGQNFYARKEIKDVLAYLKTVDNGADDLAVRRIINVPRRGIGQTTIARVGAYADERGIGFYRALCEAEKIPGLGKSAAKLAGFVTMIQNFRSAAQYLSLKELAENILEVTGYERELEESGEEDAEDRVENLSELITKLVTYEESEEEPTLSGFLEEVALVADIDSVNASDDRALLMTLHSAKGLEFPCVYLTGLEDGLFPSYMTVVSGDIDEVEEERRLMYVGMTRAKEELSLTCASSRMVHGETQYNAVSRFVKEIPTELMDNRPVKKSTSYGASAERDTFFKKNDRQFDREDDDVVRFHADFTDAAEDGSARIVRQFGGAAYTRPRAYTRKKETPDYAKPFSLSSVSSLKKGADMKAEKPAYGVGDRVTHFKFGTGTVRELVRDTKDYKVTVDFDGAGTKILYAGFAKLKKLD